jgi:kynurenine formamidase
VKSKLLLVAALAAALCAAQDWTALTAKSRLVDLTVLVGETLPAHWANHLPYQRWVFNWFEPVKSPYGNVITPSEGPYYGQRFTMDEHTGTQVDFPAHFIPPPGSKLPNAGPQGLSVGEKYPLERLMGPAAVINVTTLLDKAPNGTSPRITVAHVQAWEKQHGPIQKGDVVLFYSGYSDKYYRPFPAGNRLVFDVLITKSAPGWPAPDPQAVEYLFSKGVWHLGTDGPSMGPADAGQSTHVAGLQHGMSWEELLINLGQLPPRGAFYIALPIKLEDSGGAPTRAMAFVPR